MELQEVVKGMTELEQMFGWAKEIEIGPQELVRLQFP